MNLHAKVLRLLVTRRHPMTTGEICEQIRGCKQPWRVQPTLLALMSAGMVWMSSGGWMVTDAGVRLVTSGIRLVTGRRRHG